MIVEIESLVDDVVGRRETAGAGGVRRELGADFGGPLLGVWYCRSRSRREAAMPDVIRPEFLRG